MKRRAQLVLVSPLALYSLIRQSAGRLTAARFPLGACYSGQAPAQVRCLGPVGDQAPTGLVYSDQERHYIGLWIMFQLRIK